MSSTGGRGALQAHPVRIHLSRQTLLQVPGGQLLLPRQSTGTVQPGTQLRPRNLPGHEARQSGVFAEN